MTSQSIVKTLPLPSSVKKYWQGDTPIKVKASRNYILIQKQLDSRDKNRLDRVLRQIGRTIETDEINKAIQWARSR